MAEKIYKSYHQQLNILQSRGMVIDKGSQGSHIMRMERGNYYNTINGYKDPFLASNAIATTEFLNDALKALLKERIGICHTTDVVF